MKLDLKEIESGMPGISPVAGKQQYEACMCCLHRHGHPETVPVEIKGDLNTSIDFIWTNYFNNQIDNTWKDQEYCTEHGAICVSVLVVKYFTDYTIIERARKGTGIDYWLGKEEDIPFQNSARLEVSGIFNGDSNSILTRYKRKTKQSKQSDDTGLPTYVSVVEFSTPTLFFGKK